MALRRAVRRGVEYRPASSPPGSTRDAGSVASAELQRSVAATGVCPWVHKLTYKNDVWRAGVNSVAAAIVRGEVAAGAFVDRS